MFRILQSGMATQCDRPEAVVMVMDILEMVGMAVTSSDEKMRIVSLDDDEEMCMEIARLIPDNLSKNLESFFLQLQLAVSTVARVRGTIEDANDLEMTHIM